MWEFEDKHEDNNQCTNINYNLCTPRKLCINRHCSYDHVTCIEYVT